MLPMQRLFPLATLVAALAVLPGCGEPTNAELMLDAREYIAKGDTASATISLRAVLQNRPQAGEARYLLGKLLSEAGDFVAAEDQLRLAYQYGYPDDEVVPLLAKVLAGMNRSMALAQEFGEIEFRNPQATAELKVQIALGRMFESKYPEAAAAIDRALQLVPDHPDASAIKFRLAAIGGDPAGAAAQVDALLQRQPDNALAWALVGDLQLQRGAQGVDAALEAHRRAVALRPSLVASHVAIITMLIDRNDGDGAAAQLAALGKVAPTHPQSRFFEAVLALRRGDARLAQAIAHQMLEASPNDVRLLVLGAQAEIALGALEQAEVLLGKAVKFAALAAPPRHMLAEVYIRTGRPGDAIDILGPLVGTKIDDAYAHTLAGQAHLMSGNTAAARASFDRALALRPDDRRVRMASALAKLATGQESVAFAELGAMARSEAGDTTADLAIVNARLARGEFTEALAAIDALAAKSAQKALPDQLRGQTALLRGQRDEARRHFEAALAKEPGYYAAVTQLVALDVAENKLPAARQRLEEVRARDPRSSQARLALAELMVRGGEPAAEVQKVLDEAVRVNGNDSAAHIALAGHHLRLGQLDAALSIVQRATSTLPESLALMDALGRVYRARGDLELAVATYNRASTLWPRSPLPHIRLADAHLARRNLDSAGEHVRSALKEAPRSLEAQRLAITVALRQRRPAQALEVARRVQQQRPREIVGHVMEGDIEMALRNYPQAIVAFRRALSIAPGNEVAERLYRALLGARRDGEARQWAESWRKDHPDDIDFVVHMADIALGSGRLAEAEALYREVLQRLPQNPLAMNNVAYTMIKQGKPGALPLAEAAVRLAPKDAAILDTLAASFAQQGRFDKAIEWQVKALEAAPSGATLRLTLARYYLAAKQRDKAVAELDALAALGRGFSGYEEVAQLRKRLGP